MGLNERELRWWILIVILKNKNRQWFVPRGRGAGEAAATL